MHKYAQSRGPRADGDVIGRRQAIADIIGKASVRSQEELAALLKERGYFATQATLSRDLKALGIGKIPSGDGTSVYALPGQAALSPADKDRQRLEIQAFVRHVKLIGNLVLVHTPPGNGQGVGRALDSLGWPEHEGSVAGDDTILVVTRTGLRAKRFLEKLEALAERRLS